MRGKSNHTRWLLSALFALMVGAAVSAQTHGSDTSDQPKIIYVDADADGLNIGTSWVHAVNSLQDALLLAYFSEKPVEIRVAQGVYKPDRGLGIMPGDSSVSFQLINNVTIKGGYAAIRGHGWDVRDIGQYKSILSGDLAADDGPRLDTVKENSYHVVTSSENDTTAVLDGFTITGSGISGSGPDPYDHSSGMYNDMSSPTLIDCNFTQNKATERGAGMYNNNSNPMLRNCTFSDNTAPDGGAGMYNSNSNPMLTDCTFSWNNVGGKGAGMYNDNSNPVLLNCVFTSNFAGMSGGGMYNEKSSPTLTNCTFAYNSACDGGGGGMYNKESVSMLADCIFRGNGTQASGGGIHNNSSTTTLLSCIFNENTADGSGGGLYNYIASETSLIHCIFSGNSVRDGGGGLENLGDMTLLNCTFSENLAMHAGGGISNIQDGRLTLVNCILWDDIPDEIQAESRSIGHGRVTTGVGIIYSNVQNGWPGEGNIDIDPLFADPEHGDFHLKSHGGRWDPVSSNWIVDDISSPCIDAGSPESIYLERYSIDTGSSDELVGLERFPNGGRVNMGAYGGTPEASLSPLLLPYLSGQAFNPDPADRAIDVSSNITLSWTAGANAVFHDVYFGTNRDAVTDSNTSDVTGIYRGRYSNTSYYPPEGIDRGWTYYWRADEVDSEGKIIAGAFWSFTTIPPPKGRVCFTAETGVWVNGALVPISKVVMGQSICLANGLGKVQEVQQHNGTFTCYDILLESGNCISVAENHYFLAESGQWISLKELKAGTKLKTSKGSIGIKSITKRPMPYVGNVYNLNIAGSDRYLVGKDAVIVRDY